MKKILNAGALATAIIALGIMLLPTWRVEWVGATPSEPLYSDVFWGSPYLFGYGQILPGVSLLLTIVAVVLGGSLLVNRGGGLAGSVIAWLAALSAVLGGLIFGGLEGVGLVAVIALVGSALLFAGSHISERRRRLDSTVPR